jgi:lysophospholipase L1-like esterase
VHQATKPRWLASLALAAVAIAFSAAILELGITWLRGPQVRFPRRVVGAPWGLRYNEPDTAYRHRSPEVDVSFRINGQGMRADRDHPYEKPPGALRIVSLGDSFTVGYEVEVDETFSAVLERELRARGDPVEVLNAGVSGFSTAEELLYLERELWKYEPDLVLVSFFVNDHVDNVRTNLFRLEGGRLVEVNAGYVPGGGWGDFLNENPLLAFLSEHSNAFTLMKESLNAWVKRRVVEANWRAIERASPAQAGSDAGPSYEEELTRTLFEELVRRTRERGVPLVIQSIPNFSPEPPTLVDAFPKAFSADRPGVAFLAAKPLLEPYLGREKLYNTRSHWHWTALAHRLSGEALAKLVSEEKLLDRAGRE